MDMDSRGGAIKRAAEMAAEGCMRQDMGNNGHQYKTAVASVIQGDARAFWWPKARKHPLQNIHTEKPNRLRSCVKFCEFEQKQAI